MKASTRGAFLWVLAILPACGQQLVEFPQADGKKPDTASADVAVPDVAIPDAAIPDVAVFDAAITDDGSGDSGNSDVLLAETGITDSGTRDAVSIDGAKPDAPNFDGPTLDAPSLDAPEIDAQITDVGSIDGSSPDPVVVIDLGLATPFAMAATTGLTTTMTSPATRIKGSVVLTPDQTCNAVTVDNAGGLGLCAGMPPTITGTVITNVYSNTTTAAGIEADLNAAVLSITQVVLGRSFSTRTWFPGRAMGARSGGNGAFAMKHGGGFVVRA